MRRHRRLRRRAAALIALPVVALISISTAQAATESEPVAGIATSDSSVRYGEKIKVSGELPSAATRPIAVKFRREGSKKWSTVAETTADEKGVYSAKLRLRSSGEIRAVPLGAGPSKVEEVVVTARVSAKADRHVDSGRKAQVRGTVQPARAGRRVKVQIGDGRGWKTVVKTKTRRGGKFKASWRARSAGRYRVRVVADDTKLARGSSDTVGSRLSVYRRSQASYYGPGLYGNALACGGRLSPNTLGVAHRTLPCGTKVTFRNKGRSITVPVIDRGPFHSGRTWDLTAATKRKLGFGSTGTVRSTE